MDREMQRANGIYVVVTVSLTTAMLAAGLFFQQLPATFFS